MRRCPRDRFSMIMAVSRYCDRPGLGICLIFSFFLCSHRVDVYGRTCNKKERRRGRETLTESMYWVTDRSFAEREYLEYDVETVTGRKIKTYIYISIDERTTMYTSHRPRSSYISKIRRDRLWLRDEGKILNATSLKWLDNEARLRIIHRLRCGRYNDTQNHTHVQKKDVAEICDTVAPRWSMRPARTQVKVIPPTPAESRQSNTPILSS